MKNSFVTLLATDSFLPGVLVLNESLKKHNKKHDLLVLVSEIVADNVLQTLKEKQIKTRLIKEIYNPSSLGADERSFRYTYTKVRIFELYEFDKVVYIDADMLVCNNIESLFDVPHLSAVIAGGLYPGNDSWRDLNSGLMVIEPGQELFNRLLSAISQLPSGDGSDQGFLHSFFNDWPENTLMHLPHTYNVPFCYIDEYCSSHNFTFDYHRKKLDTNIAVIHYWGKHKPWDINRRSLKRNGIEKWEQSLLLWWDTYLTAKTDENIREAQITDAV